MREFRVRLLHISDLHDRGNDETESWRRRRVLGDAWIENLKVIREERPVDIVCFTGDAANQGKPEEFDQAGEFLNGVLEQLDLPKERLFIVPGNHDIHRPTNQAAWKRIRKRLDTADSLDLSRWMNGENRSRALGNQQRQKLLERQAPYREWLERIGRSCLLPDSELHRHLGYRRTLQLPDSPFQLHIIGLDSSWLCGDDHDSGKLRLTQDQIARLCSADGAPLKGFRLALVHHPLDELADASEARRLLSEFGVDLLLRGHWHEPDVSTWADPDRRLRQLAAGCLYEGHRADQYPNACCVLNLRLEEEGRPIQHDIRFRGWSPRGHWFDDDSLYRQSVGGRLTWRIRPMPAPARLSPLVGEVFVGRRDELEMLRSFFEHDPEGESRPIAICAVEGMPGVGKTYLADRFAYRYAAEFPGGFERLVIEPRSVPEAEQLRDELRDRLKLQAGGLDPWEALTQRLSFPRTLLHVENVDSPAAEKAAAKFLSRLPGCAVLVTGRIRDLGRSLGWRTLQLPPFGEETALEQLQQEIGDDVAQPSPEEQKDLVRQLGYLPLAIHLAAGHLRSGRSVNGFLGLLRQRLFNLEPANRAGATSDPEQARRVLASTFAISLEILSEELGDRAEELSAGLHALGHAPLTGFGRSLGRAIAGLSESYFEDLIFHAARFSLLQSIPPQERPDSAWRLHPLVAELLRTQSDCGPPFERMNQWFEERLPQGGEYQGVRWKQVHDELIALSAWLDQVPGDCLVEVLDLSYEHAVCNGPFLAWVRFCRRALSQDLEDCQRSNILWTLAYTSCRGGDLELALGAARAKVDLDSRRGDERGSALAWGIIADVLQARGQLDEALRILQEDVLHALENLGDIRSRAITMGQVADILQAKGHLDEALRIRRQEELPVFEKLGDIRSRAVTMGQIADVLTARGQLDEALRIRRQEELPAFEKLGNFRERAVTMSKVADILQARGQLDEALRILQEDVLHAFENLGDYRERAVTMGKVAGILQARGQLDEALRILQEDVLHAFENLSDLREWAVTMGKVAGIRQSRGQLDEALHILQEEVLHAFEKLGDIRERAVTMGQVADILQAKGKLDEALRIRCQEELPVYEKLGDIRSRAVTMGKVADVLTARGQLDEALCIRRQEELPVYEKLGDIRSRAVTMSKVADVLIARGQLDEALRILQEDVLRAFEKLDDIRSRAVTMGQVADVLQAKGQLDEALRIRRQEQLPVFEKLGDIRERAVTMGQIADILQARGQLDEALRIRRQEQLPVFEKLGGVRERAVTIGKIADILGARGQLDEALRILQEDVLHTFESLGDIRSRAVTMGQIADILQARGQLDEALCIRRQQELPVYEKLDNVRERAVTMGKVADILQARGQLDEALRILQEDVLHAFESLGDVRSRAVTMGKVADVLQARGQLDEALRIRRQEELPVYEKLEVKRDIVVCRTKLALSYLKRGSEGDRQRAAGLLKEVLKSAEEMRIPEADQIRKILQGHKLVLTSP